MGNVEEEELAESGADHHGCDGEEGLKGDRGSAGRSNQDKGAGGFHGCGFGYCTWSSGQIKELCGLHLTKGSLNMERAWNGRLTILTLEVCFRFH